MATDKIPTEVELMNKIEERAEYMRNNDPRKMFTATYEVNGNAYTEKIRALSTQDAEDKLRYELRLVGWFPKEIKIVEG